MHLRNKENIHLSQEILYEDHLYVFKVVNHLVKENKNLIQLLSMALAV